MRTRAVAIVVAVLAAATIVVGSWAAGSTDAEPVHEEPPGQPPVVTATSASTTDARKSERAPVEARGDLPASGSDSASPFDLRGTFVVVDANGKEHAAESGWVDIRVDGLEVDGFEVKAGGWRNPEFTTRDRLRVVRARLGGKPVVCDIDVVLDPSNPPLKLRGRWLAPIRLRVIASDTGTDLTDVRVVELDSRQRLYDWRHPGGSCESDPSVVRGVPLLLWPEPGKVREYVVGAPGYTWSHIEVDPSIADEREVRLDRSGAIDVAITGRYPYGTTVRLSRDEGGQPLAEWGPNQNGVTHLEGIPGGAWHVTVAKGLWFQQPVVLGHALVRVTPGTVASVALTLSDYLEPARAIMAGSLVYPNAWRQPPRIDIEPTGATRPWGQRRGEKCERVADGAAEYRWLAGLMSVGTYRVCVSGSGFVTRVELPPDGKRDLRIVVPEPCDFRLRLLDADTGKVITAENPRSLGWHLESPEWEGSPAPEQLTRQPDGSYVGQAPPGTIQIFALFEGYQPSRTRHEVLRGTNDFVVSVSPSRPR